MDSRIAAEREFHDRHYARLQHEGGFALEVDEFARSALLALEPVAGRKVLDCGTGDGSASLWLATRGASVVSVDVSGAALELAHSRAVQAGMVDRIQFIQSALEDLPLAASSVDLAFGNLVLHHVSAGPAAAELSRVLRVGGRGAFSENFSFNPFLSFARRHLVGRFGIPRLGTDTEQPLGAGDLAQYGTVFDVSMDWPQMLMFRLLDRQVFKYRVRWINRLCEGLDSWLHRSVPSLRHYSYRGTVLLSPRA